MVSEGAGKGKYVICVTSLLASLAFAEPVSFNLKPNHQVARPNISTCECDKAESSAYRKPGEQTKTELKFIIRLSGKWIAEKIKE